MAYPAALDTFTTKTDSVDTYLAAHMNAVQAALLATQTELGTDPAGSLTNVKTRLAVSLSAAGLLNFTAPTGLTIASGAITATGNYHTVDTESAAASDNLDTITAGAFGQVLFLQSTADARDIVIRHGVGNIVCGGGGNVTLGLTSDLALLIYDDTLDKWICQGFASLAGTNSWSGVQTFGAAENHKATTITATATLDGTYRTVLVDATAGAVTVNLPAVSGLSGREYKIVKVDDTANAVTVDGASSETINGATTKVLSAQYAGCTIICDGTKWIIEP